MGSSEVVVIEPGRQVSIALVGVVPVLGVNPLAQRGLDEAFGLAVGARGVGTRATVLESEARALVSKAVRAVAAAVVGQQRAHADAVLSVEGDRVVQEGERGLRRLVGPQLREGEARVVVDGDVQRLASGMTSEPAGRPPVATLKTC